MKIETESGMFHLRLAQPDEIEHTGEISLSHELAIIATSHAGEQIYMLIQKTDIRWLNAYLNGETAENGYVKLY